MNRRQFCKSSVAASIAAGCPILSGYGESMPTAVDAVTSIAGISLDGSEIEIERAAIKELGDALNGPIFLAGHPNYDHARRVWNGMHDKRPAMIAHCMSNEDVRYAVTFASERSLLLAVKGGGHSWPGKSTCDGGLLIDLSALNQVTVDAKRRNASAGGGALLSGLDTATLAHGLVTTTGVVSHTGVGGFTLGGGFGRLARTYGLAVDNLVGAEIVTADGQTRIVSAANEPDLFWAIRGGGGNFGVVTQFVYRLHPFDRNVLSGSIGWSIDRARDVLDVYGDWYQRMPDAVDATPKMGTQPDGTGVISIMYLYNGKPSEGEKELAPLRNLGSPLYDAIKVQDFTVTQTQSDAKMAHGIRSYAKSGLVAEVSPELLDVLIESYIPDPRVRLSPHSAGGAIRRVDDLATAFPHRNAELMIGVIASWTNPEEDREVIAKLKDWYAAISPLTGGYYDNIDFDRSAATGNFGPAYERLSRIKSQYDPNNLFRLNSNIRPTA